MSNSEYAGGGIKCPRCRGEMYPVAVVNRSTTAPVSDWPFLCRNNWCRGRLLVPVTQPAK